MNCLCQCLGNIIFSIINELITDLLYINLGEFAAVTFQPNFAADDIVANFWLFRGVALRHAGFPRIFGCAFFGEATLFFSDFLCSPSCGQKKGEIWRTEPNFAEDFKIWRTLIGGQVDGGAHQLEVVALVFAFKLAFPERYGTDRTGGYVGGNSSGSYVGCTGADRRWRWALMIFEQFSRAARFGTLLH